MLLLLALTRMTTSSGITDYPRTAPTPNRHTTIHHGYIALDIETDGLFEPSGAAPGILCVCTAMLHRAKRGSYLIVERRRWPLTAECAESRLTIDAVREIVDYLQTASGRGYVPLTWNGTSFDFRVLYDTLDCTFYRNRCAALALEAVDPMLTFFMHKGFPIKLSSVAAAFQTLETQTGVHVIEFGKIGEGADAVVQWDIGTAEARRAVLNYCDRDVDVLASVWSSIESNQRIAWITKHTNRVAYWIPSSTMYIELRVADVCRLPQPNNAWIKKKDRPALRQFTGWLQEHALSV